MKWFIKCGFGGNNIECARKSIYSAGTKCAPVPRRQATLSLIGNSEKEALAYRNNIDNNYISSYYK